MQTVPSNRGEIFDDQIAVISWKIDILKLFRTISDEKHSYLPTFNSNFQQSLIERQAIKLYNFFE